jgi:hypothetical protein
MSMKSWFTHSSAFKVAALATVVGLSSLGYEASAGFRHLRIFRSNCGGPSCAMPSCSGPSFGGCSTPRGCHSPMVLSCSSPSCSGPIYVTPPMITSACSMPACSSPVYGSGWNGDYEVGGTIIGSGQEVGFDSGPVYESAPIYGATGHAIPHLGTRSFGNPGFRGVRTIPSYYAPMSSEYAPIPPAPAAEIVW